MKRIFTSLMILLTLIVPTIVYASSISFLTLSATVKSIYDGGGLASAANISVGAKINYVIEVDPSRTGYITIGNGNPRYIQGSYYTSLTSGALAGRTINDYHYLKNYRDNFYSQTGNEQSFMSIANWQGDYESLVIGSGISSLAEASMGDNGRYTTLRFKDITVTDISNVPPVPIPASALLMICGLGVIELVRRCKGVII
ncbi:VPLPA-CTERM sorting domain-containing protein [Desulfovibrio sp. JC022]|uniref:VPLPA-CTERM sorting domain-containing protein n=1 Tax=Desulfovibrio sp. JC022 TaxID=2593642 RepID=UPI0013D02B37|nr:VPLPA-CTERM sorting domain-containing protein [Desulfovibrio sp. JC022]NDV24951.1 hypothetical protein [Desulfovibrio sp. JC022]